MYIKINDFLKKNLFFALFFRILEEIVWNFLFIVIVIVLYVIILTHPYSQIDSID